MSIYESIIQEAAKMREIYENSPTKVKAWNDVLLRSDTVKCVQASEFKSKVAHAIFASPGFNYVYLNDQHIPTLSRCYSKTSAQIVVDVLKEAGFERVDIVSDEDYGIYLRVIIE